jgi:transposase InsO family protein
MAGRETGRSGERGRSGWERLEREHWERGERREGAVRLVLKREGTVRLPAGRRDGERVGRG